MTSDLPLRRLGTAAALLLALAATVLVPTAGVGAQDTPPPSVPTVESEFAVVTDVPTVRSTGAESGGGSGGAVTAVETGLAPFTTIGASYTSGARANGLVRVHTPAGWSRWFELHGATGGGHGPDPGSAEAVGARTASDPVWVGEADGYELALPADATAVRVHLVVPTGEAAEVAAAPSATTETTEATEAGAGAAPQVRLREAWGARPYRGRVQVNRRLVRGVVHHTVNSNGYSREMVPSMLRSIQRYHQDTRGWNDIAYNFVVDRFGTIWEARARSYEAAVIGAASSGTNLQTVAVAFLGDASNQAPSSSVLRSIGRTLGWKMRKHGLRPSPANIMGHRDVGSTSCPGDALYRQLRAVESVAVNGNPPAGPFFDVAWTRPDARAIAWAGGASGVLPGYPNGTYRPGREVNRAVAHVALWRMAGARPGATHPFTDVPATALYREAVEWASGRGIVAGRSATVFGAGDTMSRQQFLDLVWRYAGSPDVSSTHAFTDAGPDEALDWAAALGMVTGATFAPTGALNRSTTAVFLHRVRPFTDVDPTAVVRAPSDWAIANRVVAGLPGHTFRATRRATRAVTANWIWAFLDRPAPGPVDAAPGTDPVVRSVAAVWLWEAAGSPTVALPSDYDDAVTGQPYEMAAAWVEDHRLFRSGSGLTFRAGDTMSRSEVLRALYRLALLPDAWDPSVTPPPTVRF